MKNSIYIIAEIGNSHEGSVGLAKKFIETVKECGANAVKLQTHLFEFESIKDAPKPYYFVDESRETYFNRTSFDLIQWKELRDYSKSLGLDLWIMSDSKISRWSEIMQFKPDDRASFRYSLSLPLNLHPLSFINFC